MSKPNPKAAQFNWGFEDLSALNKCINDRWSKLVIDAQADVPMCQLCTLDDERVEKAEESPGSSLAELTDCRACIIYKDTGRTNCDGTPYAAWNRANTTHENRKAAKAAQAELDYLEGLRDRMLLADV